jgi:hypothetical protein
MACPGAITSALVLPRSRPSRHSQLDALAQVQGTGAMLRFDALAVRSARLRYRDLEGERLHQIRSFALSTFAVRQNDVLHLGVNRGYEQSST